MVHIPDAPVAPDLSRRAFLTATGGTLAGAVACGLVSQVAAGTSQSQRGGTLRFATRGDAAGLDPHRNTIYLVSTLLAATTQGLIDLDGQSQPVPGVAMAWDVTPDLLTYTFRLRQGALFHNGREVDAAAVQWNLARMQDAKVAHPFTRSTLSNLQAVEVVDKYTVQCRLHTPSAAFLADVAYYPCNLIAPESAAQTNTNPIGCGPFKLVRWERNSVTELVRFEHYFETDAVGNSLPTWRGLLAGPKRKTRSASPLYGPGRSI